MKTPISGLAKGAAAALALTAATQSATAQSNHTVTFNGFTVNCEKLQGRADPDPGGFTCGFAQDVDQNITGNKLSCGDADGYDFEAMDPAAGHLKTYHGQERLFMHLQVQKALLFENGDRDAAIARLERNHPGQGTEYYNTYMAIEGLRFFLREGQTFDEAADGVINQFNSVGWNIPGGQNIQALRSLVNGDPVIGARLLCLSTYRDIPWNSYDQQ